MTNQYQRMDVAHLKHRIDQECADAPKQDFRSKASEAGAGKRTTLWSRLAILFHARRVHEA